MSDWFDEPDDDEIGWVEYDYDDEPEDDDDDDYEPDPPILNIDNPCSCCGGRGAYIDDLDPDRGYVTCVDCGGSGSAIDAMNKDHW